MLTIDLPDPGQLVEITDVFSESVDLSETADDLWVFGYGSLMWLPEFNYRLAVPARVPGWHRQFTCLSIKAWGTEEKPGLSAALHPGGSCLGVAFAVPPQHKEETLERLRRREAAYRHRDISMQLSDGRSVRGVSWVANPDNGRFLMDPDRERQAEHIRQGVGPRGTSLYYLTSTVHCLNTLGSGPSKAHDLLAMVQT